MFSRKEWKRATATLATFALVSGMIGYSFGMLSSRNVSMQEREETKRKRIEGKERNGNPSTRCAPTSTSEDVHEQLKRAESRWMNPTGKISVWLDCDPGHDDVLAILLAAHNQDVHLLGISTVQANQTLDKTTYNARCALEAFGCPDIPVVAGSDRPLLRRSKVCAEVHGETGLDGADLPVPGFPPLMENFVDVMYRAISMQYRARGCRDKVRVVCTAPMTNVALLFKVRPDVLDMVEVVFMGGAMGIGNTGPVAEFNVQVDPEAAKIVIGSEAVVTMIPLEVTHTALVSSVIVERIEATSSPLRRAMKDLMTFFRGTYEEIWGFPSPPLHDPCAIAYAIRPDLFVTRPCVVDVETCNDLSLGQTIVDVHDQILDRKKNVNVAFSMHVESFWDLLLDALSRADHASPMNVR